MFTFENIIDDDCPNCYGRGEVWGGGAWRGGFYPCPDCQGHAASHAGSLLELRRDHARALEILRGGVAWLEMHGPRADTNIRSTTAILCRTLAGLAVKIRVYDAAAEWLPVCEAEIDSLWARVQDLTGGTGGDRLAAAVLDHGYGADPLDPPY